jgi:ferritin
MLSDKMLESLNRQHSAEIAAFYLYRAMQSYFHDHNLDGFASWMNTQANEELGHAGKIYDYIHDRRGTVKLSSIDAPKQNWKSPLEVIEDAYAHEKKVSTMIHDLVDEAVSEKDRATEVMLQWFVAEQVEEEALFDRVFQRVKFAGDSPTALLLIDQEMGSRPTSGGEGGA